VPTARRKPPQQSVDIVVLGPMSKRGGEIDTHTLSLKKAVEAILRETHLGHRRRFCVTAPDELHWRSIDKGVFRAIDKAELVVADLSGLSVNVFYEIAFADALGIPTVLVATKGTDLPFYFKKAKVFFVEEFTIGCLRAALSGAIVDVVNGKTEDVASNPLSEYYQAAVVDISAAVGLVAGYFANFLGQVIRASPPGLLASPLNRTLAEGILIVIPNPGSDSWTDWREARKIIRQRTGLEPQDGVLLREGANPEDPPRPFSVKVVGRMIVDIASPVYALSRSPRITRLKDAKPVQSKMLDAMVARFRHVLDDEIAHPDMLKGVTKVVALSELAQALPALRGWWFPRKAGRR
jgi:hypothetical protein